MIKLLFWITAALIATNDMSSARTATVSDVIWFVRDGDKQWEAVMIGVARGVEGASVHISRMRGKQLFCPPANLAITADQTFGYLRPTS